MTIHASLFSRRISCLQPFASCPSAVLKPSRLLVNCLARNESASARLQLRLLLRDAPAYASIVRLRLLQHNAFLPLHGIRRPLRRPVKLERVRVARAHEREPVRDELLRERLVQGGLGLERRRPVEARARPAEHHPVLGRVVHLWIGGGLRARALVVAVRERLALLRRGEPDDGAPAADVRFAGGDLEALRRVVEVGLGVDCEELLYVGLGQAGEVFLEGLGDVGAAGEGLV